MPRCLARLFPLIAGLALWTLSGCGGSTPATPSKSVTAARPEAATAPVVPPTAPIAAHETAEEDADAELDIRLPEPGTPEFLIHEITKVRAIPYGFDRQASGNPAGGIALVKLDDADAAASTFTSRMNDVIEKATQAISMTHEDKEKEQTFNNAVHYLADARLQLALAGDHEQAQMMDDDAEALFHRDATSFAAVEARHKVVQLAQATATRYGRNDPEWIEAFARQARMFAEHFPQEQSRAAVNLMAAGQLCEAHALHEEARTCYFMIEEKFPESPFAQQIAGVLRRLRLVGQPLDLGGPTLDGGFLSIDQFRGKHVLVVFWASNSEAFLEDLPQLKRIAETHAGEKFMLLGVNLDQDERAVDQFLEQAGIGWRQVFYSEADKRGLRNPVARHYSVQTIPTYWLVDPSGQVLQAPARLDQVEQTLGGLLTTN